MHLDADVHLLTPALPDDAGVWIDLGAGEGLFSRALAAGLAPGSRIIALDRNASALERLRESQSDTDKAGVIDTVHADLSDLDEVLVDDSLDGAVLANALHFVSTQTALLRTLRSKLRKSGRIIVVEYDNRPASPWVPYPVPTLRLEVIACAAGLDFGGVVADRPSRYGGRIYTALLTPSRSAKDANE